MILSDKSILEEMEKGNIKISPFDIRKLGSNSYDVHLSKHLAEYNGNTHGNILDSKKENEITRFEIPEDGYLLLPNRLYLGSTLEYTETHNLVPILEGKSSIGRLGLFIHVTAGFGDAGFCNHWTLEMVCIHPIRVYAGMPIGQIHYHEIRGEVLNPYNKKKDSKYTEVSDKPQPSGMWSNFSDNK